MRIARRIPVTMGDFDQVTIAVALAGIGDDTLGNRDHRATHFTREINTLVHFTAPGNGMGSHAEIRRQPALGNGPSARFDFFLQIFIEYQVFHHGELIFPFIQLQTEFIDRL